MTQAVWDVFLSHASEDKDTVARPLANHLSAKGLKVWFDESAIQPGESLRAAIDRGLACSALGLVVLSPTFFAKKWTLAELGGLFALELDGANVLVPLWHGLDRPTLLKNSPMLADRLALNTNQGYEALTTAIKALVERARGNYRPGAPSYAGPMRKALLLSLPEGSFILSNSFNFDLSPKVAMQVPPVHEREALWQTLKTQKISTSRFYVFRDSGEYRAHMVARGAFSHIDIYDPRNLPGLAPSSDA